MNSFIQAQQEQFSQALAFFEKDIATLRTGRANPGILDGLEIDAYGSKMAINAVGNIAVADGRSLTITPWDKTILKEIEKAVTEADLGVGVVNEGDKLRLTVPMLTEENRKELVKKLNGKLEEARINIRKIRDEVKQAIEKAFEEKTLTEDDKFRFLKELDEFVGERNDQVKAIRDHKEKDIMTI